MHHRGDGRRLEVQQPALQTFLLRIGAQHTFGIVVQTCQQRLVSKQHRPSIGSLEHILTVLQGQLAQFGTQLAIYLLVLRTQVSTVIGKTVINILQHLILRFVQLEFVALVVHRFDALEEFLVQTDGR